ncbi:MAG TPA: cytochrome c oxidase subunit 3 [Vicinamibacterales bacterium]|nr:cytochrome c oxidase subunit 3 [Vicinamibacterales bacterium]
MSGRASRAALDVSPLPTYAFGHRSVLWWGTMCMIAIEAMAFALVITSYLYLKGRVPHWPDGVPTPRLFWGTLNVVIMLVSAVPNELTKRAAERFDRRGVQIWLTTSVAFAAAFTVVRFFEFSALNVRWDTNAYGSVTWVLLGFHTVHVLTDLLDSAVLNVMVFTGPMDEHRFVDVSENAFYYYFVIATWLPIYGVLYLAPRIV